MKQIFKILSCLSLVTLGTIAHAMESKQPSSQDPTLKWELIPNDNAGEPSSLCPLPQNQASRPSDSKEFFKHFPLRGCLYSPTTDQYTLYPMPISKVPLIC